MQFQWKNYFACTFDRIWFFVFLWPFFEAFGEIIDAFQLHILREELIIYKTRFLEAKLKVKTYSNKRPQKHDFFISSFLKFDKILWIFFCQNQKYIFLCNFQGKIFECGIVQNCIFCVFVALFWSIWWDNWCLPITYFKRGTYYLQNAVFGS